MDFERLIIDLETSSEVLDNENDSIYIKSFINNEKNKNLILSLLSEKKNNIPYLRNIYTIIIRLFDYNKNIDFLDIQNFLYDEFKNGNLKKGTEIIFTNLLIKISNNNYLEKIIIIYDKQIIDDSISIGSIEKFTDYFCEYEKGEKFVDCFLYFRKDWIRFGFNDGIKGFNNRQQGILDLTKDKYVYFLQELGNKKSLKEYVWHLKDENYENNFTQKIIDNGFNFGLKKELYDFLISLIKYGNDGKDNFYKEKVYYKQVQDFFNRYREKYKEDNFFIRFFNDINYDKKGFYYFRFFENFIANILQSKNDINLLLEVDSIKSNDYIFAYRIYQHLKELGKINLTEEFEKNIGNEINEIKLKQEEGIRKNDEYFKNDDKEKYEEIKSILEMINKDHKKGFLPILFKYYIENENLLFSFESEGYDINKIIEEQIYYFLEWENLNPGNIDALKGFKKTEGGYNGFTLYFDESLGLVLKVADKLLIDLSPYKQRLSYFIPFQLGTESLNKLLDLCGFEEFEGIYNVYKNYDIIANFHPQNFIIYYEKVKNLLNNDLKKEVLAFFKLGILKYKSFYDKEKVLDFLYDFGEPNKYFQDIFDKNKLDINYFNYGNKANDEYQSFRLALKANEILIKNGYKESIEWRLEQIKGGKTENREYGNGFLPDDDINLSDDDFIKVLKQIKSNNIDVIDLFIDLLKHGFDNYEDNYTNYCFYIFKSFNYYLSGLSNLSNNKYLVNKIGEILSKIEKIDSIIYFKRYIDEFENGLFLEKINTEIEKNLRKKYESKIGNFNYNIIIHDLNKLKEENIILKEENIIFKKEILFKNNELEKFKNKIELLNSDIIIITEGKTDWKHFIRAWRELDKSGLLLNKENKSIKNIYDFEELIVKYDNDFGGDTEVLKMIINLNKIYPNKIIIGIFDTDFTKIEKGKWSNKKLLESNYDLLQEGKTYNNIHLGISNKIENIYALYLQTPDFRKNNIYDNNICIEFFYDIEILNKYNFITKCNYGEKICKFNKNFYKVGNYYYGEEKFNKTIIVDGNKKDTLDIYDEFGEKIEHTSVFTTDNYFYSKNEFANDILGKGNGKGYKKPSYSINLDTWKRFLFIFQSIEEIIITSNNYEFYKLNSKNSKNNINICFLEKIKFFIKKIF